jgi:transcriptional regulator with XRE-family HTH domain
VSEGAGKDLRDERLRRGMSVRAVADATGLGESTIKRLEGGQTDRSPSLDVLQSYFKLGRYKTARIEDKSTAELVAMLWRLNAEQGQAIAILAKRMADDVAEVHPRDVPAAALANEDMTAYSDRGKKDRTGT